EIPMLDDLSEEQRQTVFSRQDLWKGRARPARKDENIRFAAYYFYKSLQTGTNANPLRVERIFGNCLDRLGHYRSKTGVAPEVRKWDDWGSEEWWAEMIRRNAERGLTNEITAPQNLQRTLLMEIGLADSRLRDAMASGNTAEIRAVQAEIQGDYQRFRGYFPNDTRSLEELVKEYRKAKETDARLRR